MTQNKRKNTINNTGDNAQNRIVRALFSSPLESKLNIEFICRPGLRRRAADTRWSGARILCVLIIMLSRLAANIERQASAVCYPKEACSQEVVWRFAVTVENRTCAREFFDSVFHRLGEKVFTPKTCFFYEPYECDRRAFRYPHFFERGSSLF